MSDDSHGPHAVGLNYDKLYRYLRNVGIQELWYLKDTLETVAGAGARRLKAERLEGNWWQNEFWVKLGCVPE